MGLDDKTQPLTPVIEARGRLIDRSPVSVIDIGSNSVRLVVYEGRTRSPTPLFNEKVMCGLGRSVAETGKLDPAAAKRALDALQRFTAISHRLGSGKPWALATAAIREATDGDGFLADVERVCGVKVLVLSGAKEAELAAAGVLSAFHDPLGVVGDLGGGSLELLSIGAKGSEEGNIDEAVTRKLGGLRLMQRSGGDLAKAAAHIEADLASVDWLKGHAGEAFYAVGGTWRAPRPLPSSKG